MGPLGIFEEVTQQLKRPDIVQATNVACPNNWATDPGALLCTAEVDNIAFGTGHQIYRSTILPAVEAAETEVILVTCFWARSETLDDLNNSLRKLSATARRKATTILVRLCFSSSSLWQKLSQSSSSNGHIWPEAQWRSYLGLPDVDELQGLDIEIKSVFQLPFSVMHPKFVIIDRERVLLPSCNVSWENWFEGCIDLRGSVVLQFVQFWQCFWASDGDQQTIIRFITSSNPNNAATPIVRATVSARGWYSSNLDVQAVPAMFLPSPHHRFDLPWLSSNRPPPTPLNIYLLTLLARAEREIYIQTPNLTSEVVLSELLAALERGVDVTIVTSRKLMRLEQMITAGTTTGRCVRRLRTRYEELRQRDETASDGDLELGLVAQRPGRLIIRYYEPRVASDPDVVEPVQSHLKLTLIDSKIAVLGSGNMDRASWHTSQELGLALTSEALVKEVWQALSTAMEGRSTTVYDSD
ncbi:hypothetical protein LTR91_001794 [Friedmanniomyces endolithicus]|uniref:PLD phosphodiesterase domain-containing protein n=1 Tax=Friedmanniomyces endolithicus TaxID=329885 RepID=A0AAN6R1H1_9PEZI|nr:hypothetical protein LTR91_001794 [Friedmanniomyces endolithicus]